MKAGWHDEQVRLRIGAWRGSQNDVLSTMTGKEGVQEIGTPQRLSVRTNY